MLLAVVAVHAAPRLKDGRKLKLPGGSCKSTSADLQDDVAKQQEMGTWCEENCIPQEWGGFGDEACRGGTETGTAGCVCEQGLTPIDVATGQPVLGHPQPDSSALQPTGSEPEPPSEDKKVILPSGTCKSANADMVPWCEENCIPQRWGGIGVSECSDGTGTGAAGCVCKQGVAPIYAATGQPVPESNAEEELGQSSQSSKERKGVDASSERTSQEANAVIDDMPLWQPASKSTLRSKGAPIELKYIYMFFHCFNISQPVTGGSDPPPNAKDFQDSQSACVDQCHKEPDTCDPMKSKKLYKDMHHYIEPATETKYKYECGKNTEGKEDSEPACGVWTGFCYCWETVSKFPMNLKESPIGFWPVDIIRNIIVKAIFITFLCNLTWTFTYKIGLASVADQIVGMLLSKPNDGLKSVCCVDGVAAKACNSYLAPSFADATYLTNLLAGGDADEHGQSPREQPTQSPRGWRAFTRLLAGRRRSRSRTATRFLAASSPTVKASVCLVVRYFSSGGKNVCVRGSGANNVDFFYVDRGSPICAGVGGTCHVPSVTRSPEIGWTELKNNGTVPSMGLFYPDDQGVTQGYTYLLQDEAGTFSRSVTCRTATVRIPKGLENEPVPDVAPDKPDVQCTSEVPCEHGVGPCAHDNQCWGGRCYGRHKARNLLKVRLPHEWPDDWGVCWRDQEAPSSDEKGKKGARRSRRNWPNADTCPDGWETRTESMLAESSTFDVKEAVESHQDSGLRAGGPSGKSSRGAKSSFLQTAYSGSGEPLNSSPREEEDRMANVDSGVATRLTAAEATKVSAEAGGVKQMPYPMSCPPGQDGACTAVQACEEVGKSKLYMGGDPSPDDCNSVGCCRYIHCQTGYEKEKTGKCIAATDAILAGHPTAHLIDGFAPCLPVTYCSPGDMKADGTSDCIGVVSPQGLKSHPKLTCPVETAESACEGPKPGGENKANGGYDMVQCAKVGCCKWAMCESPPGVGVCLAGEDKDKKPLGECVEAPYTTMTPSEEVNDLINADTPDTCTPLPPGPSQPPAYAPPEEEEEASDSDVTDSSDGDPGGSNAATDAPAPTAPAPDGQAPNPAPGPAPGPAPNPAENPAPGGGGSGGSILGGSLPGNEEPCISPRKCQHADTTWDNEMPGGLAEVQDFECYWAMPPVFGLMSEACKYICFVNRLCEPQAGVDPTTLIYAPGSLCQCHPCVGKYGNYPQATTAFCNEHYLHSVKVNAPPEWKTLTDGCCCAGLDGETWETCKRFTFSFSAWPDRRRDHGGTRWNGDDWIPPMGAEEGAVVAV